MTYNYKDWFLPMLHVHLLIVFISLKNTVAETERERENSLIHWFTPQMATTDGGGTCSSQKARIPS